MLTNTGAPQRAVLSPFLFSLFTADCRSSHKSYPINTFADDKAGIDDDDSHYRQEVAFFFFFFFFFFCLVREKKGGNYYIVMNLGKTMEMVIDFRQMKPNYAPIMIKGEVVE